MNRETLLTIGKGAIIVLILLAFVFALKMPAADLHLFDGDADGKALYTDASGLPYFSEMDSYYNYRLTNDYIDHGFVGDEMVNGTPWDNHRYAPDGNAINYEMGIVQVTSWLHNMANNFLGWDMSVKEVAFWAGAIISTFCVIPAFIFSRRLTNDYGAIVATLIIALAPNYFAHLHILLCRIDKKRQYVMESRICSIIHHIHRTVLTTMDRLDILRCVNGTVCGIIFNRIIHIQCK